MASIATIFKSILNVKHCVLENFVLDRKNKELLIRLRPYKRVQNRCPFCGRRCPGYDSPGDATWRSLDFGGYIVKIQAQVHRVKCPEHGVVNQAVPWADPDSRFTHSFEKSVTWCATQMSRKATCELMRIDWKTVGRCLGRVKRCLMPDDTKRFDKLRYIGIDETSYRKGHKYITVVVNHETNEVIWCAQGHGSKVLDEFFKKLTSEQRANIEAVTADGARWITESVHRYCPNACRCIDPYHVVTWAQEALDKIRKQAWHNATDTVCKIEKNTSLKRGPRSTNTPEQNALLLARSYADTVKGSMYVLGKAPENLTPKQQAQLEFIVKCDRSLYRGYLLKEQLRLIFKIDDEEQLKAALKTWFWRATHSRIPVMRELAYKIRRHNEHILNTQRYRINNARIEATNNKIKLIIRKAFGFRNIQNLLDMVMLVCSSVRVPLPDRS